MKYTPPLDSEDAEAGFVDADPANGKEGSLIPAGALENPQREIINAIKGAGLTPSATDNTQLKQALDKNLSQAKAAAEAGVNNFFATSAQLQSGSDTKKCANVKQLDQELFATLDADRKYEGVNLTTKFATEIAQYANVWAWIQARIQSGNFKGIHVGDYIPFTTTAGTVGNDSVVAHNLNARIVGIDTYYRAADTAIGHHIDFITKECITNEVVWNPSNCNNGSPTEQHPWLQSAVYAWLNGVNNARTAHGNNAVGLNASGKGLLQRLPTALQNVIIQKRNILDARYSSSALIKGGTNWDWQDMGKLWLPNEIEVYGHQVRSNLCNTDNYWNPEAGLSVQYPWFAGSVDHRILSNAGSGRTPWWLSSVASHTTTHACIVGNHGNANNGSCTAAGIRVPVCFRIG